MRGIATDEWKLDRHCNTEETRNLSFASSSSYIPVNENVQYSVSSITLGFVIEIPVRRMLEHNSEALPSGTEFADVELAVHQPQ